MLRHVAILGWLAACTEGGPDPIGTDPTAAWTPQERISRLLRSDAATRLEIRAHVPEGEVLPGDPWARLIAMLEEVTDKPDGVTLDLREVPLDEGAWTFEAVQDQLDALARPVDDDVAVIEILAVHGTWPEEQVLGLGWSWSRMLLLLDPLTDSCTTAAGGGSPTGAHTRICEATWAGVMRHETGHLLGLVNNELPMVTPHEDPEHEHHDPDPDCLMYWAWDRADVAGKLAEDDLDLCPASLADLAAVREGGR